MIAIEPSEVMAAQRPSHLPPAIRAFAGDLRDTPDWTFGAFWAYPERVLDADARNATSGFARMPPEMVARVERAERDDLESGRWDARHGHLRTLDAYDAGMRLLVSKPG